MVVNEDTQFSPLCSLLPGGKREYTGGNTKDHVVNCNRALSIIRNIKLEYDYILSTQSG